MHLNLTAGLCFWEATNSFQTLRTAGQQFRNKQGLGAMKGIQSHVGTVTSLQGVYLAGIPGPQQQNGAQVLHRDWAGLQRDGGGTAT